MPGQCSPRSAKSPSHRTLPPGPTGLARCQSSPQPAPLSRPRMDLPVSIRDAIQALEWARGGTVTAERVLHDVVGPLLAMVKEQGGLAGLMGLAEFLACAGPRFQPRSETWLYKELSALGGQSRLQLLEQQGLARLIGKQWLFSPAAVAAVEDLPREVEDGEGEPSAMPATTPSRLMAILEGQAA